MSNLGPVSILILCYFLTVNLLSFLIMGIDKKRAKKNLYRVPEKTLFFFAFIGGATGGILGMILFRHKTKRKKFTIGFPLILLLWIAGLAAALILTISTTLKTVNSHPRGSAEQIIIEE